MTETLLEELASADDWQASSVADIVRNPARVAASLAQMRTDLPNLDLFSLLKKWPFVILMVSQQISFVLSISHNICCLFFFWNCELRQ